MPAASPEPYRGRGINLARGRRTGGWDGHGRSRWASAGRYSEDGRPGGVGPLLAAGIDGTAPGRRAVLHLYAPAVRGLGAASPRVPPRRRGGRTARWLD